MLGLSFSKLVFLIVVIAVVWYGFKWLGHTEARRVNRDDTRPRARARTADRAAVSAEDTVRCSVCDTYVVARDPRSCGRAGCPYPPAK